MTYRQALDCVDETPVVRVSSGLGHLDLLLSGGFPAGTVSFLLSRPQVGRSTLALQFARVAAANGQGALFCGHATLEQTVARLRAAQSQTTLRASRHDQDQQERISRADAELAATNLLLGWARSEAELRGHVRSAHGPLQMVVLDGLYEDDSAFVWRPTARDLAWFARGMQAAVLVTVGVPAARAWPTGPPRLVDATDPCDLAEYGDFVLSLGRPDELAQCTDGAHVGEATRRLVLNRQGPAGDVHLAFQGALARFVAV